MERTPPLLQQSPVSHLVRDSVLEGVLDIGTQSRLVEKFSRLQPVQSGAQGSSDEINDAVKPRQRHVLADHRRDLGEPLVVRIETIETRCEHHLHGRRDLDRVNRLRQSIRCALAGGQVAGVAGMSLSVPLISVLPMVWRRLRPAEHRPSDEIDYRGSA